MKVASIIRLAQMLIALGILASCGGGGGSASAGSGGAIIGWAWISGSNTVDQAGTYGTLGVANAGNVPGARADAVSWIDGSGNRWLFGGFGRDSSGTAGLLNDLWRYDGMNWTWISGSDTVGQSGTYGALGVPSAANVPGARSDPVSWVDGSDHLWLFGGDGLSGPLNDLWRFDGTNWTWISGSNAPSQAGIYGSKGVASAANTPGARFGAARWIDSSDNLWLFGGFGLDGAGIVGRLNDLWRFDGANWTWISGGNAANQLGTYGTRGSPGPANVPGGRTSSVNWIDSSGSLWLFGGLGFGLVNVGRLNDLWRFDGTNWTWISGSNTVNQSGVYGVTGVASATNVPGARTGSVSWVKGAGDLWLFGGFGFDSGGTNSKLNDLWRFDGTNWTWIAGSDTVNQSGTYGTLGVVDPANVPGARFSSVSWIDGVGNLWLFGGDSTDGAGGYLNDLWRYQP